VHLEMVFELRKGNEIPILSCLFGILPLMLIVQVYCIFTTR